MRPGIDSFVPTTTAKLWSERKGERKKGRKTERQKGRKKERKTERKKKKGKKEILFGREKREKKTD